MAEKRTKEQKMTAKFTKTIKKSDISVNENVS